MASTNAVPYPTFGHCKFAQDSDVEVLLTVATGADGNVTVTVAGEAPRVLGGTVMTMVEVHCERCFQVECLRQSRGLAHNGADVLCRCRWHLGSQCNGFSRSRD